MPTPQATHSSDSPRRTLLLVDDEPSITQALRRLLRRSGYRILTAASGAEALEKMEQEAVGVIISDYRMPGMSGGRFLAEVRRRWPDTYRILLTGQADMEAVLEAINEGAVHKFLLKPWNTEELPGLVAEAFRQYELVQENRRLQQELERANAQLTELNANLVERIRNKAQELSQALYYDAVTGLPNRVLFADRLAQAIVEADARGTMVGVLLLGLDGFRLINDSLGHAAGDRLLRRVGERLQTLVHGNNTVARPGGDEFCILVNDAEPLQMEDLARRVLEEIHQPFQLEGQEVFVSCSIGISFYPEDGRDNESLLRNAHVALHQAKNEGRNTFRLYREQLNEDAGYRLALRSDLRHALERREFVLYLQPKVAADSGLITSAEALLRWVHPRRGMISPVEFIPLLEETGLIESVGEWVLEESCAIIRRLQEQARCDFTVAANLSPRQFHQQDLAQRIGYFIERHGLRPEAPELELEITESMLMRHESESLELLRQLHDMGIRLAIDDFGTGYSSLSYLTRFPVDYLKIDRSFITQIGHSHEGEAVVRAIISMARDLDLKVIAEGVETRIQLEFLRMVGCDLLQGYLFSPPVPEADLAAMLGKQERGARLGQNL